MGTASHRAQELLVVLGLVGERIPYRGAVADMRHVGIV
jgi:hypothetical protein